MEILGQGANIVGRIILLVYFESNENTSVKTSEATGNNGSRRSPPRQSYVITSAVYGKMQHERRNP